MASAKPFSLTSENLKKFEKELQAQSRQRKSLQRNINTERTEADGRSSGIQSYGSQLSAFKDGLSYNATQAENKKVQISNRKHPSSLDRPEPEAFRRNPEGQSRNESWQATPNIVKLDYEEGSDHISYKSNSEEETPDNENETSDDSDDDDDDDDDDSEEESAESEEESDEDDEDDDDDDDDDDEDEGDTETTPRRLQETPVSVQTHYTSSLNASSSSIPTIASAKSKAESTKTTKTIKTERKGSAASNISSAPSYIMNVNQFRLKKMAVKKEKERQKLGRQELTESELSFGSRPNYSAVSRNSMRERITTSAQSKGSYVTVRNWSRWSTYSGAGYSISEGPTTNNRFRKLTDKQKNVQNIKAKTPRARPQYRSQVPHLPVIGKNFVSKSHSDLRKAGKRHVTLTVNPDPSRTRPVSRSQMASGLSTRSIIKTPTAPRVKSVPDLNREAVMSFFLMDRGLNKSGYKIKSASQKRQSRNLQDTDRDDEPDFTNRQRRVLKRKERPQRNEPALSSASSMRSKARQRNNRASSRNGRRSSLSIASALSMTSSKSGVTGRRGHASSSASSKPSVTPRKPRLKPLRSNAGYQSNQDLSSSRCSLLAPGTPIDLILQRSPSLRSAITEYSSYLSLAASSVKSARPSSRSSLSSTGEY